MTEPRHSQDAKYQVREIFEQWADHYDTERASLPYFRAQLSIALSMLAGEERGRILDIGCAAGGEITDFRALAFPVVGIDLAPTMLNLARRRFAHDNQVQFCRADVEKLPFATGSMQHVVCLGVFEFLTDYDAPLEEIHRVLRPGGLAIFAIPTSVSLNQVMGRLIEGAVRPLWRTAKRLAGRNPAAGASTEVRFNRCVPWKFRAQLRRHGLEPERSSYSNFFIYPLERFPAVNVRVTAMLEPLCSLPLLRCAASVYLVCARRE